MANERRETGVLILGGGFAGWYAARKAASNLPPSVSITLVDKVDHMLYTPMLTEVAGGSILPATVAVSEKNFVGRVRFIQAEVLEIDAPSRTVNLSDGQVFSAQHLVLALGSTTSYHNIEGAKAHSLAFKTLTDAETARQRVDEMVTQAASLPVGSVERKRYLTLIVAGGGYTGVETMAALYSRLKKRAAAASIPLGEITALLVEPTPRLMREMPLSLAKYSQARLETDGVRVLTNVGVDKVVGGIVHLANGEQLKPGLLLWDAGVEPNPLIKNIAVPKGKHHGVVVDESFRVKGLENVWAIGDCAEIPNEKRGGTYAPTAQNAVREGTQLARNIALVLKGQEPRPFRYKMLGQLAVISAHDAVAHVLGIQLRGFVAWLMWWCIYIAKLPGNHNRMRALREFVSNG